MGEIIPNIGLLESKIKNIRLINLPSEDAKSTVPTLNSKEKQDTSILTNIYKMAIKAQI